MERKMSKLLQWIVGIGVIVIAIAVVFSAAAPCVAPGLAGSRYGMTPGMMSGGWGMMTGGGDMMNGGIPAAMHNTMLAALAEGLNLSRDDLEARLAAGERLSEIADAQGIDPAELPALVVEARKSALAQAVADGSITQADAMAAMMIDHVDCPLWNAPAAKQ
jgi:hypothetical protein